MHGSNHGCQCIDWITEASAIHPAVQVMRRSGQRCFQVAQSTEASSDRWRLDVPHASVTHDGHIALQFLAICIHEGLQARAAGFLFSLNHQRHGAGRSSSNFVPGAERFNEHHHLTLVIHGAARNDPLAVRAIN